MVNMGMGQDQVINIFWVKSQFPVKTICLKSLTLVHSTIKNYSFTLLSYNKMFTARNFSGSSKKFNFHRMPFLKGSYKKV